MLQHWFLHAGFVLVSLILTLAVKNLNPPKLDYQVELIATIDCVNANLSGITYNPQAHTFFIITNAPEQLVEISPLGDCLKTIDLKGFEDTEDVFYLAQDKFLIVEERKQALNYVEIKQGQVINSKSLILNIDDYSNTGLEGVTYNAESNSIYLVNERPQKIIRIAGWNAEKSVGQIETVRSFWSKALMDDYSAITNIKDGLLVLSHESNRLLKLDYQGSVQGSLELISEYDSHQSVVQPEGVAMDHNENIYIVSEPNHLHVYKKKPAAGAGFSAFALEY